MTSEATNKPVKVQQLIDPQIEQVVVSTFGFALYPVDQGGETCEAVAFPRCRLNPHRPKLFLPQECVAGIQGLQTENQGSYTFVDLEGHSVAFGDDRGPGAEVVSKYETASGHFRTAPAQDELDFNLVPDFETFSRGLALPRNWRDMLDGLQGYFAFAPGRLGGLPDHLTDKVISSWGFDPAEEAKQRRTTVYTAYISKAVPTRTLIFRSLDDKRASGSITTTPFPGTKLILVGIMNGPVKPDGSYEDVPDHELINFSHMEAMIKICTPVKGHSVKFDYSQRTTAPVGTPREIAMAAAARFRPTVANLALEPFNQVSVLSDGYVGCGARKQRVSS